VQENAFPNFFKLSHLLSTKKEQYTLRLPLVALNLTISYFFYANDKPTVKKISFIVKGGKTVMLIKLTRSSKSTLLNLLKRFINSSKRSIKINSQNISNVILRSL